MTGMSSASEAVRTRTGIVIPVYFPPGRDHALAIELLRDTVDACLQILAEPTHVCVSVDGEDGGRDIAEELHRARGTRLCVAPVNRGKLHAVRLGVGDLWPREELEFFCVVDADGDHFANELPTLMRAAQHARAQSGVDEVLVLGSRTSRHRPMGWLRGELEELADRVLFDALHYHAAVCGRPLRLECVTTVEEFPDFHSGYKLFSRGAAARPRRGCRVCRRDTRAGVRSSLWSGDASGARSERGRWRVAARILGRRISAGAADGVPGLGRANPRGQPDGLPQRRA